MVTVAAQRKNSKGATAEARHSLLLINYGFIEKATDAIKAAKSRIWICAYTWQWYGHSPELAMQQFNSEVVKAKNRGVQVRALMYHSKQAEYIKSLGIDTRMLTSRKMMHAKVVCVDSKTLILGSHNLTKKGTEDNMELSLLTQDLEAVLQFERFFNGVWVNYTK